MVDIPEPEYPRDAYDSPWKDLIENHFREFLAFFFDEIHEAVDWTREIVFLDKELSAIAPDHE